MKTKISIRESVGFERRLGWIGIGAAVAR
jgi:hypothetical protein